MDVVYRKMNTKCIQRKFRRKFNCMDNKDLCMILKNVSENGLSNVCQVVTTRRVITIYYI